MYPYCFGPLPLVPESVLMTAQTFITVSIVTYSLILVDDCESRWVRWLWGVLLWASLAVAVMLLPSTLLPQAYNNQAGINLVNAAALAGGIALVALAFWGLAKFFRTGRHTQVKGDDDPLT